MKRILTIASVLWIVGSHAAAEEAYYFEYTVQITKPEQSDRKDLFLSTWFSRGKMRCEIDQHIFFVFSDPGTIYGFSPLEETYWQLTFGDLEKKAGDLEREFHKTIAVLSDKLGAGLKEQGLEKFSELVVSWLGDVSKLETNVYRTNRTKKIKEWNCYEVFLKGGPTTQHLWVTDDIEIPQDYAGLAGHMPNSPNRLMSHYQDKGFTGFPVLIESTSTFVDEIQTITQLEKFERRPVSKGLFDLPGNYRRDADPFEQLTEVFVALSELLNMVQVWKEREQSESQTLDIPANVPAGVRHEIERLGHEEAEVRVAAARMLGNMGKEALPAIPFLLGLLDDDARVKSGPKAGTTPAKEALNAIRVIGEPAIDPLIRALEDSNELTRRNAVYVLGEMGYEHPRVVPALLIRLESDEEWRVRSRVPRALRKTALNNPDAVTALLKTLRSDTVYHVRIAAVDELGKIGISDPNLIPAMIVALRTDENLMVRGHAAISFGRMRNSAPEIVNALTEALQLDNKEFVRWKAAEALGDILEGTDDVYRHPRPGHFEVPRTGGRDDVERCMEAETRRVLEVLVKTLASEGEPVVQTAIARALGKIGCKDPGVAKLLLTESQTKKDGSFRAAALEAIGRMGYKDSQTVDSLIGILRTDQEESVRSKAAYALGMIAEREENIVDALIRALEKDAEGVVRACAALALGRIGGKDPRVVEALISALTVYDDRMTTSNTASALREITGRGLGTDAARWEKWWEQNHVPFFEGQ